MPNRIIKESICTSDTIDQMSWFEECFWHRLIVNCDDYGRFDARPAVLKSRLFPLKERITLKDVESALTKLAGIGCVVLYEYDGKPYLYLPTWEVHQTIRAKKSRYPAPVGDVKTSESICMQMHADESGCPRNPIQSESEIESESESESKSDTRGQAAPLHQTDGGRYSGVLPGAWQQRRSAAVSLTFTRLRDGGSAISR